MPATKTTHAASLQVIRRILQGATLLPRHDQLAVAAKWRLEQLLGSVDGSTRRLALLLDLSVRQVQRIRRGLGLADPHPGEAAAVKRRKGRPRRSRS
ncbi:MAG: hypothetical protein HYV09_02620 [Deltaproteobacteria bacterium]|nr:hypothetical protein [Deltaproteobacteria bacterium]